MRENFIINVILELEYISITLKELEEYIMLLDNSKKDVKTLVSNLLLVKTKISVLISHIKNQYITYNLSKYK